MADDRELWACAHQLMRQHGRSAWLAAAKRAEELLALGELEGHRAFLAIRDRIEQLETAANDSLRH